MVLGDRTARLPRRWLIVMLAGVTLAACGRPGVGRRPPRIGGPAPVAAVGPHEVLAAGATVTEAPRQRDPGSAAASPPDAPPPVSPVAAVADPCPTVDATTVESVVSGLRADECLRWRLYEGLSDRSVQAVEYVVRDTQAIDRVFFFASGTDGRAGGSALLGLGVVFRLAGGEGVVWSGFRTSDAERDRLWAALATGTRLERRTVYATALALANTGDWDAFGALVRAFRLRPTGPAARRFRLEAWRSLDWNATTIERAGERRPQADSSPLVIDVRMRRRSREPPPRGGRGPGPPAGPRIQTEVVSSRVVAGPATLRFEGE